MNLLWNQLLIKIICRRLLTKPIVKKKPFNNIQNQRRSSIEKKMKEKLELEMKKLRALNAINIEGWKRLERFIDEKEDCIVYDCAESVIVGDNQITLKSTMKKVLIPSFTFCFKDVKNKFNRALPEKRYFDLSEEIREYEELKSSKALEYIPSWVNGVGEAHALIGELEKKKMEETMIGEKVKKMFGIPEKMNGVCLSVKIGGVKQNSGKSSLEFECKEEILPALEKMRDYLFAVFKVENYTCTVKTNNLEMVSTNANLVNEGGNLVVEKTSGENSAWDCNVASNILSEGIHRCKFTIKNSAEGYLMIGVHNGKEFNPNCPIYTDNGKYLLLCTGTIYGSGEHARVAFSYCYSQGTLIEMKMDTNKGEISWKVNNGQIVRRTLQNGPWRFSFSICRRSDSFYLEFL